MRGYAQKHTLFAFAPMRSAGAQGNAVVGGCLVADNWRLATSGWLISEGLCGNATGDGNRQAKPDQATKAAKCPHTTQEIKKGT